MSYKLLKNKKGLAPVIIFLIAVGVILALFLGLGGISGFILKNTFEKIPIWFWVGSVFFILIILGRKKK